jgi:hypothetical protein
MKRKSSLDSPNRLQRAGISSPRSLASRWSAIACSIVANAGPDRLSDEAVRTALQVTSGFKSEGSSPVGDILATQGPKRDALQCLQAATQVYEQKGASFLKRKARHLAGLESAEPSWSEGGASRGP